MAFRCLRDIIPWGRPLEATIKQIKGKEKEEEEEDKEEEEEEDEEED